MGKKPSELCLVRNIWDNIQSINDIPTAPPDIDYRERDWVQKRKGKKREDIRTRRTEQGSGQ